jgi:hypothetical protein
MLNDPAKLLSRLNEVLPLVRSWIGWVVAENYPIAQRVDGLGFRRVVSYFPVELLDEVRFVTTHRIPFPPVVQYGLTQFASLEEMPKAGITFDKLIFIHESMISESVAFHELVHALQWKALGVDDFLLTYAVSTLLHGYANNPLEATAYDLQSQFDRDVALPGMADLVRAGAEQARALVAENFRQHRIVMGA